MNILPPETPEHLLELILLLASPCALHGVLLLSPGWLRGAAVWSC